MSAMFCCPCEESRSRWKASCFISGPYCAAIMDLAYAFGFTVEKPPAPPLLPPPPPPPPLRVVVWVVRVVDVRLVVVRDVLEDRARFLNAVIAAFVSGPRIPSMAPW